MVIREQGERKGNTNVYMNGQARARETNVLGRRLGKRMKMHAAHTESSG